MEYVTIGKYSMHVQTLKELTLTEAYEQFHFIPKNVVKHLFEQVNGKAKKKAKTEKSND